MRAAYQHLLVQPVIIQTTRRILQGEAVPAPEKVVNLYESHTAIIRKGKPGQPAEFGRVLWLDEVEGGIISRYAVLEGNPAEDAQLPLSLEHHLRVFKRPPHLLTGDRGVHSIVNERYATRTASRPWCCPNPGPNRANESPTNSNAGSDGGEIGERALKGASVA
jgi:IS5 family transposase